MIRACMFGSHATTIAVTSLLLLAPGAAQAQGIATRTPQKKGGGGGRVLERDSCDRCPRPSFFYLTKALGWVSVCHGAKLQRGRPTSAAVLTGHPRSWWSLRQGWWGVVGDGVPRYRAAVPGALSWVSVGVGRGQLGVGCSLFNVR